MLGEPIPTDADELLARMRADRESPWPDLLADRIEQVPLVDVRHLEHVREDRNAPTLAELTVLRCAAVGLYDSDTADLLGLSLYTVKKQMMSARYRLRAKNRTHAVALAIRQGLI
jgi:DNA-binding CsgD family transcriptional regulator